ncbi:MAG: hypothetical protein KKF79_13955, partial [Gammaproteobacteria bacterium]|nr:hypothetical protein [Gammaproteobacteria bacterium]
ASLCAWTIVAVIRTLMLNTQLFKTDDFIGKHPLTVARNKPRKNALRSAAITANTHSARVR